MITNKTYEEIRIGDDASLTRVCTEEDLFIFAHASGNLNPLHLPAESGEAERDIVAPSMWVASLFSALLGNVLPGAGTLYKEQSLRFLGRAHVGDTLTARVKVVEKGSDGIVILETRVVDEHGTLITDGRAQVIAPTQKMATRLSELPGVLLKRRQHFDHLQAAAERLAPMPVAVVCPEEQSALTGALLARERQLIEPVLIGCTEVIRSVAEAANLSLADLTIIDAGSHAQAAAAAVRMVHAGRVQALMKGFLHTDDLMHHVLKSDGGLRTAGRVSHVFIMDVPGMDHLLYITDAAINILPTLAEKVDIVQNAINLGIALGCTQPRVGVLSAVETVNPRIPSTLDAAILSKMADRGQIKGGLVDGPLAMDNAVDMEAARTKGIHSLVAGRADILVAPNLEAGNMLAKELVFIARAESAGLVVGAQVPVILPSRADSSEARLDACAAAVLYQHWRNTGESAVAFAASPGTV